MTIPAVLLPYQQLWVSDQSPVSVWEKSRRIGASWGDASDSVLMSAPQGGMDSLYIGYSEDMTREYIDDCAMWARAFQLAAGDLQETVYNDEGNDIKAFRIDYASGCKTLALSSRPRSIRGKQGKVTIDEAAFHDDLDGLLTAALALLIWGGKVRVMSSHNGEDNPFNLLVKDIRAGKYAYSLHRTTFDDALRDGLYERVRLTMGERLQEKTEDAWREKIYGLYGDRATEELDCVPKAGSGVYLPRTLVERCQDATIPILRFTKPPEWVLDEGRLAEAKRWVDDNIAPVIAAMAPDRRTAYGQDFGRSGDLSVIWVLQEQSSAVWRTAMAVELRNIPFDVQGLIRDYLLDELPLLHHAKFDARGNGQSHAEAALQRKGPSHVECVMLSATWYALNFPPYRQAYEDRSIVAPPGEDVIADHRRVVLDKGRPKMDDGRDKGSDGGQRHGDSAVAGVLAWAAAREEGIPAAGSTVVAVGDPFTPERRRGLNANTGRQAIFKRRVGHG